jgi:lysophospholipase L1-like esterase
MKQNYHKEVQAKEKEQPAAIRRNNIEFIIENDTKIRMMDDHDHLHYDVDRKTADLENSEGQFLGSNLVSINKVHPNDEGYELWGRHIAAAIIKHWNKV